MPSTGAVVSDGTFGLPPKSPRVALSFGGVDPLQLGTALGSVYETAEPIQAMRRWKAGFAEGGPCDVRLEATGGKVFHVGGAGGKVDGEGFPAILKGGQQ